MNKTINDQSKYFAGINKDMSETRRAGERSDSNKDDKHRGSSEYARGSQTDRWHWLKGARVLGTADTNQDPQMQTHTTG